MPTRPAPLAPFALALVLPAALLTLALLAACSSTPGRDQLATVTRQEWQLVDLAGAAPLEEHPATLTVTENGGVSGRASVNRFSAGAVVRPDGTWKLESPMVTRMAGPQEAMDQEGLVLQLLIRADAWRIRRGHLELLERGRVLLRYGPAPEPR